MVDTDSVQGPSWGRPLQLELDEGDQEELRGEQEAIDKGKGKAKPKPLKRI